MLMTVLMVSSASPPRASATRGTKSKPEERQAERLEESFLWTPTCRAWPGDRAASAIVRSCSGLMTSTSKAVGRPRLQQGMNRWQRRGCHCYIQSCVDFTVTCRVIWTSLLHTELCGLHCYMQSYVDFTVTYRVVWTSLLHESLVIHRARLTYSARFYYARAAAFGLHLTGPFSKPLPLEVGGSPLPNHFAGKGSSV